MSDTLAGVITKRQLGLALTTAGALASAGVLAVDLFGVGEFQAFGPAQRLALAAALISLLVGLSLIPLGERPA